MDTEQNEEKVSMNTRDEKISVKVIDSDKDYDNSKLSRSLLARIKEAKIESQDNNVTFLCKLPLIIIGSLAGIASLFVANVVPFSMIIIGSVYFGECNIRPKIPIILIISGIAMLTQTYVEAIKNFLINGKSKADQNEIKRKFLLFGIGLTIITFASFIAACVLVYGSDWPTFDDKTADTYCNATLFLFAYWILNLIIIFLAYVLVIILLAASYACFSV